METLRMQEQKRATELARAIDEMLAGGDPKVDDTELEELLQIARMRRDAAREAAGQAAVYERQVWELLMKKLRTEARRDLES